MSGQAQDTGIKPLLAWLMVGVLLALALVSNLDRQIIGMIVGPMRADLHINDVQVSLLQGVAFALMNALSLIPLGYAVDHFSRRKVIFAGVTVWGLAAVTCGLVSNYPSLLAARMFVGIGEAALLPAAYSILSDSFPKARLARVMSVFSSGTMLGNASALMFGGFVFAWAKDGGSLIGLSHLRPWQTTFVVTGLPGLVLACVIFLLPEPRRSESRPLQGGFRDVVAFIASERRLLFGYIGGFAVTTIFIFAIFSWMAVVLMRVYGWAPSVAGLRLGLFLAVSGVGGQLLNGTIVDRWFVTARDAYARYYMLVLPLTAVSVGLGPLAPNGWVYMLCLAPATSLLAFTGVAAAGLQLITPVKLRGRMSAFYLACLSIIGLCLGPTLPALFTEHLFRDPMAVRSSLALTGAVVAPIAAGLFYLAAKPMRRRLSEVPAPG